jgi:hypothetical protein
MLAMMMCSFLGLLPAAAAAAAAAPAGPYLTNPCLDSEKFKQAKFCDPTLGIDERAADIVSRLSIVEKIDALGTNTGASLCLFCSAAAAAATAASAPCASRAAPLGHTTRFSNTFPCLAATHQVRCRPWGWVPTTGGQKPHTVFPTFAMARKAQLRTRPTLPCQSPRPIRSTGPCGRPLAAPLAPKRGRL